MEPNVILKQLECIVCKFAPKCGPLYQCPQGHLICSPCYPKLNKCPKCKKDIDKNLEIRNLTGEKILQIFPKIECSLKGCSTKWREDLLEDHEKKCLYQMVKCYSCSTLMPINNYELHLDLSHDMSPSYYSADLKDYKIKIDSIVELLDTPESNVHWYYRLNAPKPSSMTFIAHLVKKKTLWYLWVDYIGTNDIKKYCKIMVGKREMPESYRYCQVHSILKSEKDILESGDYLLLDNSSMKNLRNLYLYLHFNFFIQIE